MFDDGIYVFFAMLLVALLCGLFWTLSASTIAKECRLMGQFYIGDTVYECKVKEKKTNE